ncbi:MAG: hypothetical protein P0S94_02450, partial [Simkaniaceae bacterium]|nr:hypothetical protein [Simkaniaceae bacterium]
MKLFFSRPKPKPRNIILRPNGKCHNLDEILKEVLDDPFEGEGEYPITWFGSGKMPKSRVTYAAFDFRTKMIKVNRVLDMPHISKNVLHFLIYHEILHHKHPPKKRRRGTHHIPHAAFREKEREHPSHKEATTFL